MFAKENKNYLHKFDGSNTSPFVSNSSIAFVNSFVSKVDEMEQNLRTTRYVDSTDTSWRLSGLSIYSVAN